MSKIKEEIKNLKTEIGIHDLLIQDLFSNAIRKLDEDAAQYLKSEIEKSALDASKIYDFVKEEKTEFSKEDKRKLTFSIPENLKALREAAIEADWFLSDATEVLAEICYQGFCYPESINILREVMATSQFDPRTDSKIVWESALTKIIEKRQQYIQEYGGRKSFEKALHRGEEIKESFCCSQMARAVNKGLFKTISYNTDLARFQYLVFSFTDANYSRSTIIQYCPFCGKKIDI